MANMLPNLASWFVQIFVILLFTAIYQSFLQKKYIEKRMQEVILTFLCAISIVVCTTFPVLIQRSAPLDFRYIPLIVGFLFGSYRMGLGLSIFSMAISFTFRGRGIDESIFWSVFFLVAFWFMPFFNHKGNAKWKKHYPYFLITISILLEPLLFGGSWFNIPELKIWLMFYLLNGLTVWIMFYLQKLYKEKEMVSEKLIVYEKNHMLYDMYLLFSQHLFFSLEPSQENTSSMQGQHISARQFDFLYKLVQELNYGRYLDLSHSFHEKLPKQGWNFVKEFEGIVEIMQQYAEINKVKLIFTSTAEKNVSVKGDHTKLRIVLINLIKNAIETCKPESCINVSLHEMLKEVYIVIEGNGMGKPYTYFGMQDEPGLSKTSEGTEHKLASAFKITKLMGGRVKVETSPEEGTTFSLYIPKWA